MSENRYSDYEIFDSHAHIYPEKIAAKATENIGRFYDIPMFGKGSSECLLESGAQIGVAKYLVCGAATSPEQVCSVNDFIAGECRKHPEFIGFGTMHPDYPDIGGEIERMISLGLHGIKLHPDFQKFNIDCEGAYRIYDAAAGRLPILFHMGDNRYTFSKPYRLARVNSDFPQLRAIAAHLGGYRCWRESEECLMGLKNIVFDCSSSMSMLPAEYAKSLMCGLGLENIMFGSDFPMWSHKREADCLFSLGFSDEELRMIFSGNFKRFFEI